MERFVLLLLALMLARIVLIIVRLSYLLAQRPKSTVTNSRPRDELASELRLKLRSLRQMFSTAPYLGLLGTCFGIVDTLSYRRNARIIAWVAITRSVILTRNDLRNVPRCCL